MFENLPKNRENSIFCCLHCCLLDLDETRHFRIDSLRCQSPIVFFPWLRVTVPPVASYCTQYYIIGYAVAQKIKMAASRACRQYFDQNSTYDTIDGRTANFYIICQENIMPMYNGKIREYISQPSLATWLIQRKRISKLKIKKTFVVIFLSLGDTHGQNFATMVEDRLTDHAVPTNAYARTSWK